MNEGNQQPFMRQIFVLLSFGFCSCATLQSSHTDNVKAFARSAKVLSAVPGKLYSDMANYRYSLKMIEVSTVHRPEKLVEELDKIAVINSRFQNNAVQIAASASLIESYAECLLALTDAAYEQNWHKQSDELSLQLHTAFACYNQVCNQKLPVSAGRFIGEVVTRLGSIKLRSLQKKYLRNFVDTGALIIGDVCDYFTGTVGGTVEAELSSLDNQSANVMTHFYDEIYEYQKGQSINSFDYLKQYNPLYMEMKARLENLHTLEGKTMQAMQRIKEAHQSLQSSVDAPGQTGILANITALYLITSEINAYLKKSEKHKDDQ